jgi:U2 small nuclear ribonucleoprotein B''
MVPGRKGLAFVEYDDDASATTAKEKLHNRWGDGDDAPKMKVSFAKA